MNKVKLVYDVVKKMKEKETFKGTLKVEGMKDQEKMISIDKSFEKNSISGQSSTKSNMEVGYEGKKVRFNNSMDFENWDCHGMHGFGRMHHFHDFHHIHEGRPSGIKEGMNRILFMLGIFDSLKVEEQEDKSVILSLDLNDIPEEIKKSIAEKMHHEHNHIEGIEKIHEHHMFMKEFHGMENTGFKLKAYINQEKEIEKVTWDLEGTKKDDKNEKHDMKLSGLLCFGQ